MPTTAIFTPDTVEGSSIDYGYGQSAKIRGGLVTGITGDPATALDQCLFASGMPTLGHQIIVGASSLIFRNLKATAVSGDTCRVQLVYDNNTGLQPSAYTIDSRSFEQSFQTDLLPGTRQPLRVDLWTNPDDSSDKIPGDNVTFTFSRTMRVLSVSGLKYGNPPTTYEEKVGYANDAPWRGKPIGYWRITEGGTNISKYSGYYTYKLSALTQNDQDWSSIGVLVNKLNGRKAKIKPADLTTLLSSPYSYGSSNVNGAIRVCPYQTTSFSSLFGF